MTVEIPIRKGMTMAAIKRQKIYVVYEEVSYSTGQTRVLAVCSTKQIAEMLKRQSKRPTFVEERYMNE